MLEITSTTSPPGLMPLSTPLTPLIKNKWFCKVLTPKYDWKLVKFCLHFKIGTSSSKTSIWPYIRWRAVSRQCWIWICTCVFFPLHSDSENHKQKNSKAAFGTQGKASSGRCVKTAPPTKRTPFRSPKSPVKTKSTENEETYRVLQHVYFSW